MACHEKLNNVLIEAARILSSLDCYCYIMISKLHRAEREKMLEVVFLHWYYINIPRGNWCLERKDSWKYLYLLARIIFCLALSYKQKYLYLLVRIIFGLAVSYKQLCFTSALSNLLSDGVMLYWTRPSTTISTGYIVRCVAYSTLNYYTCLI